MNKQRFWNWLDDENTLYLDGVISESSWYDDDITPQMFKSDLEKFSNEDITVVLNSPGGCCFAAASIYNMLKEHKGKVTVKIDALAASAASVVAMAGDEVLMSPVAMIMIHNPYTIVFGEASDLKSGVEMLDEIKESIINAYEAKTGLGRRTISNYMNKETWMNAKKAVELSFADGILYETTKEPDEAFMFDRVTVVNSFIKKLPKIKNVKPKNGAEYSQLIKRLELIGGMIK